MKNKLLTSILAIMLVLVAGVSALEITTTSPIEMTEDTAKIVTLAVTAGNETTEEVACAAEHLSFAVVQSDPYTGGYTVTITPEGNYDVDTDFTCTVTNGADTDDITVDVTMTANNDAPAITSTADLDSVVDEDYSYNVDATDVEGQAITYALTTSPTGMAINSTTGEITWTPENDQIGNRDVVVTATDASSASTTQSFAINARPKKVCQDGCIGDLEILVNDPDNGDEYKAGEEIEIDVQVENDGDDNLDVTVKAMLYNLDDGKLLASVSSDETRIKDQEEESFELALTVPTTDFDTDDDFMLYVVAYEDEDENCDYEEIPVTLNREDDDVTVTELTLTPEETPAGKTVTATITVENIGEDDQDNVYIKLRNSYLDLNQETASFDLDDYKSDDNEFTETITFEIPRDADAKEYWVEAVVYFDSGRETDSLIAKLTVTGEAAEPTADVDLPELEVIPETGATSETGKQVAVPIVINNNGDSKATFTLEVSNVEDWATVTLIEQPETLNAGEDGHAYVYLKIKEDAAIGVHEFSLNVRNDLGLIATKKVGVKVEGLAAAPVEDTNKVTGLFTAGSTSTNAFYAAGAAVLVLVGLFFLRMLFKK